MRHGGGVRHGGLILVSALAALAASAGGPAGRLAAQDHPQLAAAVRLSQEGASDSARAVVSRLLQATPATDTLYPQILFTLGTIATSAQEREQLDRRVAIEFPASAWADDALLRLAQMDYAANNPEGTARQAERIRTDHPSSPLLPQVAFWAARAYFDLRDTASACRWLATGLERVGEDVELRNQLGFYQSRCPAPTVAGAPAASATADTVARTGSDTPGRAARPDSAERKTAVSAPAGTAGGYSVQVAAVRSRRTADDLVRRLEAAGFEGRVVQGSDGLLRVRVGRYPSRSGAASVAAQLKAKLGGTPYVVAE
ncbi:MAG TPA: SPOR domain-containing protein [Gemmatimonadales bacterium]|nr:SPOR domain-containing protein [Gemmatimonadales bacterium]